MQSGQENVVDMKNHFKVLLQHGLRGYLLVQQGVEVCCIELYGRKVHGNEHGNKRGHMDLEASIFLVQSGARADHHTL